MECNVCFDIKKTCSTCPFCEYISCRTCLERYSLETVDDLHCMNCKRSFDRSTQTKMFTSTFINKKYKERREELLFQRECALLPATQQAILMERNRRSIQKEIDDQRIILSEKMKEVSNITRRINELTNAMYRVDSSTDVDEMKTAGLFVMKCAHEDCKGFVSRAYKCGTCSKYTCPDCHEAKNDRNDVTHVCDEEKKMSVSFIQRDCKPCVSCGTLIHKISGCPQMFCTQCNILFDWNTGKRISHAGGHNPHFIHWLRENGRNARDAGDVLCGGFPHIHTVITKIEKFNTGFFGKKLDSKSLIGYITECMRTLFHIHHYERPRYPIEWNNTQEFELLRVKWCLKDFTDSEYKTVIQRVEKKNLLKKEVGLVLEMIINSTIDILQRFVNNDTSSTEMQQEMENIKEYSNKSFENISKDFSNKAPRILDNWNFVSKF